LIPALNVYKRREGFIYIYIYIYIYVCVCVCVCVRTEAAKWLRCCATNRKVAGSIPAGVSGFFIDIKSF